jgi:NAD(P)H-dependent FMN reductase
VIAPRAAVPPGTLEDWRLSRIEALHPAHPLLVQAHNLKGSEEHQRLLIVATSLNPESRSQALARIAFEEAKHLQLEVDVLDLRDHPLPLAGTAESWDDPRVTAVKERMQQYQRFVFVVPIYNYDTNAAAKNLLELCGGTWMEGSVAGFVCAAGGQASYMSALGLMNSLMLDFRVWIAPRFVYVTSADWSGEDWRDETLSAELRTRLRRLVRDVQRGPEHPVRNP